MYNRYIPQPDGTHRRNPTQEPPGQPHHPKPPPACAGPTPEPCPPPCPPKPADHPQHNRPVSSPDSLSGFFKNLLPANLDTADLVIILLLLLMAGNSEESKNSALLTLALYFFM